MVRGTALTHLPAAIVITDLDDHILAMSEFAANLTGANSMSWIGVPFSAYHRSLQHNQGAVSFDHSSVCRDLRGTPSAIIRMANVSAIEGLPVAWVDILDSGDPILQAGTLPEDLPNPLTVASLAEWLAVAPKELTPRPGGPERQPQFLSTQPRQDLGVWLIESPGKISLLIGQAPTPPASASDEIPRMVHDIRNPLTTAKGLLQHIRPLVGPEQSSVLDIVTQELDRASGLLGQLLGMAHSAGNGVAPAPLDLCTLLHNCVDRVQPDLQAHGIVIALELPDHPVTVLGDWMNLERVTHNLLRNAEEALIAGGHVNVALSVGSNRIVVLRIKDDGPGIKKESLPHIFEPHYTTKPSGVGLGLTICKQIVEDHQGRIAVTSDSGAGTTFTIFLPCYDTDADAGHGIEPNAAPSGPSV